MSVTAVFDVVATDADIVLSGSVFSNNGFGIDGGVNLMVYAVNGAADLVGQPVVLTSGAIVTLNADGSFDYDPNGAFDDLAANVEATDNFTYTLTDGTQTVQPGEFAASFDLSTLDGSNGFVINGIDTFDRSGFSVSGAGDINGDGIDDLIIGAYGADGNDYGAGESYVVFGRNAGFSASFDLSTLDGSNGFVLNGIDNSDKSGFSVSDAGDVNGDGIDDLIIGAPDASNSGASYVVFGRDTGFAASLDLSTLDGSNGFVIKGDEANDDSGKSVSGAGDVNGDGFDDLIIGAPWADGNGNSAGESYVVFGKGTGFSANLDLTFLFSFAGFTAMGIDRRDNTGISVSGAGDINGDGIDDLIIGASRAEGGYDSSGASYVVFGRNTGFSSKLDLSTLNGDNGFVLISGEDTGEIGLSASGAGDINGDGFDDLIIGAPDSGGSGFLAGESYVVFGKSTGFSSSLDMSALDGSNGFVLNGFVTFGESGSSVSGAGDINGDGIDDLIIGAPDVSYSGASYVVFGRDTGFAASLDLSTLDGSNGFLLNAIDDYDHTGFSVSGAGDVNGDGIDDLIIGAPDADPNGGFSGESYVVFGRASFTPIVDVTTVSIEVTGVNDAPVAVDDSFDIDADQALSGSVLVDNGAGADSDPDLGTTLSVLELNGAAARLGMQILLPSGALLTLNADGSFDYDPNGAFAVLEEGDSGEDFFAYMISDGAGGTDTGFVTITVNGIFSTGQKYIGSSNGDVFEGGLGDDTIVGRAGNDSLVGGSGEDWISGGSQADTLHAGAGSDVVDGGKGRDFANLGDGDDVYADTDQSNGNGRDTVLGGSGNDTIDGNSGDDSLDGGNGADLIIGGNGADWISGGAQADTIFAGTGSDVVDGGTGRDFADLGDGDDVYTDSTQGNANGRDTVLGGAGNDTIHSGGGADRINGGDGLDQMTGGADADVFVFDSALTPGDTITDFEAGTDQIELSSAVFTGLSVGGLAAAAFETGSAAADASDRVIYDAATGALWFDYDGTGGADAVQFVTLGAGLALSQDDFVVV